jgi:hypothetical protein
MAERDSTALFQRLFIIFLQVIGFHTDPEKKIGDIDSSEMVDSDWICKSRLDPR